MSPRFTEADELIVLRAIITLPESSLRCAEIDDLILFVQEMRLQRVAGEFPPRFRDSDRRSLEWLADDLLIDSLERGAVLGLLARVTEVTRRPRVATSVKGFGVVLSWE